MKNRGRPRKAPTAVSYAADGSFPSASNFTARASTESCVQEATITSSFDRETRTGASSIFSSGKTTSISDSVSGVATFFVALFFAEFFLADSARIVLMLLRGLLYNVFFL